MLRAILNKSWQQHPQSTNYTNTCLPPLTKTIQVRRTRHARYCSKSRDELISDVLLWTPTYARAKAGGRAKHTYSSYVRIWDVALKTCQRWWTIGGSSQRGSGISVPAARHHDDDDRIYIYIYIYIYIVFRIHEGRSKVVMSHPDFIFVVSLCMWFTRTYIEMFPLSYKVW